MYKFSLKSVKGTLLRGTATIDRGSEADLGSIMVIWGFNIFLAFRDLNNRFQKKS